MEHKRLTERVGKGVSVKATSTNDNMSIWNAIDRLAELEDKIENGELFSIPFIWKRKNLDDTFVVVYENEHGDLVGTCFTGKTAKAEAEQKLKELKDENTLP